MTRVVFDVGNVLIDWHIRRVYRGRFADDAVNIAAAGAEGFDTILAERALLDDPDGLARGVQARGLPT